MYQRFGLADVVVAVAVSFIALEPSGSQTEHKSNGDADQLIRNKEEYRGDCHHHEHHGGCNGGFPARRPSHLAGLLPHLLEKFKRRRCHSVKPRFQVLTPSRPNVVTTAELRRPYRQS